MEWTLDRFLSTYKTRNNQILSLGAGFDTMYFVLSSKGKLSHSQYIEVDFPEVVSRKRSIIANHVELSHEDNYNLIGCDLTDLTQLEKLLQEVGVVNRQAPTLILSEVVLTYVDPLKVNALLSWLCLFFHNAVLCMYEQIHPHDGFGQVMMQHFIINSAPLLNITQYPTQYDHQYRVNSCGWSDVVSCDMNTFYRSLPASVRGRTLSLEPFDEFEEWHLACLHYQLLCAFNGECAMDMMCPPLSESKVKEDEERISLKSTWLDKEQWELQRFGHASVCIGDSFLIHGGFGISGLGLSHSRLTSLISVSIKSNNEWKIEPIELGNGPGGIMYHTLTYLPSGEVLLIGGRGSPIKPNPHMYVLHKQAQEWTWKGIEPSLADGVSFESRWRHTANLVKGGVVLIIGGRNKHGTALRDIWGLDTSNMKLEKLSLSLPVGTHSHVAVGTNDSEVLIIGGLDSNLCPLNTSMRLSTDTDKWRMDEVIFTPSLPPMYSMTAHVIGNDQLLLVGGVKLDTSYPVMVLVNLHTQIWKGIDVMHPFSPVPILHNHSSFVIVSEDGSSRVLYTIGGGGNFFSFGTHFNKPMSIKIQL